MKRERGFFVLFNASPALNRTELYVLNEHIQNINKTSFFIVPPRPAAIVPAKRIVFLPSFLSCSSYHPAIIFLSCAKRLGDLGVLGVKKSLFIIFIVLPR
jgi:hypothetical protein